MQQQQLKLRTDTFIRRKDKTGIEHSVKGQTDGPEMKSCRLSTCLNAKVGATFNLHVTLLVAVIHSEARGCSLKNILVHPPKKGFKILIPYFRVNNSSNSVFKSFFIYKIFVHQKKFEKSEKSQ